MMQIHLIKTSIALKPSRDSTDSSGLGSFHEKKLQVTNVYLFLFFTKTTKSLRTAGLFHSLLYFYQMSTSADRIISGKDELSHGWSSCRMIKMQDIIPGGSKRGRRSLRQIKLPVVSTSPIGGSTTTQRVPQTVYREFVVQHLTNGEKCGGPTDQDFRQV